MLMNMPTLSLVVNGYNTSRKLLWDRAITLAASCRATWCVRLLSTHASIELTGRDVRQIVPVPRKALLPAE
jgi:hypothetical protein